MVAFGSAVELTKKQAPDESRRMAIDEMWRTYDQLTLVAPTEVVVAAANALQPAERILAFRSSREKAWQRTVLAVLRAQVQFVNAARDDLGAG